MGYLEVHLNHQLLQQEVDLVDSVDSVLSQQQQQIQVVYSELVLQLLLYLLQVECLDVHQQVNQQHQHLAEWQHLKRKKTQH